MRPLPHPEAGGAGSCAVSLFLLHSLSSPACQYSQCPPGSARRWAWCRASWLCIPLLKSRRARHLPSLEETCVSFHLLSAGPQTREPPHRLTGGLEPTLPCPSVPLH